MRASSFAAAACVLLAACGGADTSQANNAQANISDSSRTATHATASSAGDPQPAADLNMAAGPVSGAEAVRIMHERHEGMETIGKTAKTIKGQLGLALRQAARDRPLQA